MPAPPLSPSSARTIGGWPPRPFACTCRSSDDSLSVRLTGELDLATSSLFEQTLAEAQDHAPVVSVDLRDLAFIDGAGLFVIVAAAAHAVRAATRLELIGANGQVARLFELTGLPPGGWDFSVATEVSNGSSPHAPASL